MTIKKDFFDFDQKSLSDYLKSLGEKPFRAGQLMAHVYKRGESSLDNLTEFSAELRGKLSGLLDFSLPRVVGRQASTDGTVKLLLEYSDGEKIETVLIPDEDRLTQCVSTQAGCAMGCKFCRTATLGFTRNLTAGEIVRQVMCGQSAQGFGRKVTNVVFMGMGEPLHNFDATVRAFNIMSADFGLGIPKRRLTVSTSGLVPMIKKLPPEMLASLAISLNATTDEVRSAIMPVNKSWPIAELIGALKNLPLPPRAQYTIEYVLLGGVNDTDDDARRLVRLLNPLKCKVNLIALNPGAEGGFEAPTHERVKAFQTILLNKGMTAILRKSRGEDILAACGQLRTEKECNP